MEWTFAVSNGPDGERVNILVTGDIQQIQSLFATLLPLIGGTGVSLHIDVAVAPEPPPPPPPGPGPGPAPEPTPLARRR